MCGHNHQHADMFSYLSLEQQVREDHPLRKIVRWPTRPSKHAGKRIIERRLILNGCQNFNHPPISPQMILFSSLVRPRSGHHRIEFRARQIPWVTREILERRASSL
jgi:hypothetical protein